MSTPISMSGYIVTCHFAARDHICYIPILAGDSREIISKYFGEIIWPELRRYTCQTLNFSPALCVYLRINQKKFLFFHQEYRPSFSIIIMKSIFVVAELDRWWVSVWGSWSLINIFYLICSLTWSLNISVPTRLHESTYMLSRWQTRRPNAWQ